MKVLILTAAFDQVERVETLPDTFGSGGDIRPAVLGDFLHPDIVARSVVYAGELSVDSGWGWDGEKPVAPAPTAPQPRRATAKQLRYALSQMGKRADWTSAVAASSSETQDWWEFEPDPIETAIKLKKLAVKAGVNLVALYDLAVTL